MGRVELVRERTRGYLRECVGEVVEAGADHEMVFPFGSTQVRVSVEEETEFESSAFVHLCAVVAEGVPVSNDFLLWLATASNDFLFGRLTLDLASAVDGSANSGSLRLNHTLLGDYLDLEELRSALAFLASTADHLDDIVVERFGGRRFVDGRS